MSLFQYLKLQPVEPTDDGSVSDLDNYAQDDTIDLSHDEDGEVLAREWEEITDSMHQKQDGHK